MGFIMSFTDQYGETHPESYWNVEVHRTKNQLHRKIVFYGWTNKENRDKTREALEPIEFYLGPEREDLYNIYFSSESLSPEGANPEKQAYLLIKEQENNPFQNAIDD